MLTRIAVYNPCIVYLRFLILCYECKYKKRKDEASLSTGYMYAIFGTSRAKKCCAQIVSVLTYTSNVTETMNFFLNTLYRDIFVVLNKYPDKI